MLIHRVVLLSSIKELWSDVLALYGQNQAKSRLAKEQEKFRRAQAKRCFVLPTSTFRLRWDVVQVVLLLATALFVPYRLCFDSNSTPGSWTFVFDIFSDTFFLFDIFVNFRTAIKIDGIGNNFLIKNSIIAKEYAQGWLVIDIISCLPVNWVEMVISGANESTDADNSRGLRVLRVLRLFRLTKMLRLFRLKRIIGMGSSDSLCRLMLRQQHHSLTLVFVRRCLHLQIGRFKNVHRQKSAIMSTLNLMKVIIFLLYSGHVMACVWYGVGSPMEFDDEQHVAEFDRGWVQRYQWMENQTGLRANDDVPWLSLYVTSYFLSVTNEAAVLAQTTGEKMYVSVQYILYTLIVSYLTGTVTSAIAIQNVSKQKFMTKINELREFMEKRRIPEKMRLRINDFYDQVRHLI
eukprot:SAG31_NODE_15_length_37942_cov_32.078297_34_plen_404_part_00